MSTKLQILCAVLVAAFMLTVMSCLYYMLEDPIPHTAAPAYPAYVVKYKITDRYGNTTGYLIREGAR